MTGHISNITGTTEEYFSIFANNPYQGMNYDIRIRWNGVGVAFEEFNLKENWYEDYGASISTGKIQVKGGELALVDTSLGFSGDAYGYFSYDGLGGTVVEGFQSRSSFCFTRLPDNSNVVDYNLVFSKNKIVYRPVATGITGESSSRTVLTADVTRSGGNKSFTLFTPADTLWRMAEIRIETPVAFSDSEMTDANSITWQVGTAANPILFCEQQITTSVNSIVLSPDDSRLLTADPIIAKFVMSVTTGTLGISRLFARFERLQLIAAT